MSDVTATHEPQIEDTLAHATALQQQAADPAFSVWVNANAGAGKTRVLIDRISRLLLAGVAAEKILCLTFTKAAAAEMENRLSTRLGQWAMMDDVALKRALLDLLGTEPEPAALIRARQLFAQTLETPGGLKIRTIHAFCESLLGRFPVEAGIAPHARVMDDRAATEIMTEARERVYRQAFRDSASPLAQALNAMAGLIDEGSFDDVMRELLSKRERLRHSIETMGGSEAVSDAVAGCLGLDPGETMDSIMHAVVADAAFDRGALQMAMEALQTGTASDQQRAQMLAAWLAANAEERIAQLDGGYLSLFLKQDGEIKLAKNLITKKPAEAQPAALDALLAEQQRIYEFSERLKAVRVAEGSRHLVSIAGALIEAYESMKRHRALLDYDDLILKALELLKRDGGAGWVHFKLDGGIDHILVDEAQDTSPEQWEVIAHLADEFFAGAGTREAGQGVPDVAVTRTIFAVGDEKQSIYSFQGADPAGFARMREHFASRAKDAHAAWRAIGLEQSFRTTSAVLDVVDAVFARPLAQPGVSDENGTRHRAQRRDHAGVVELWPAVEKIDVKDAEPWDAPVDRIRHASPMARTAETIANAIAGWLQDGDMLESRDRPIEPGDIMILVPKRGQFADEMVRLLKARDIPVAGSDRMVLTDQIAVMDLIAAARFTLLRDDDLTLATVLKGPFVGLSEDHLFALAHDRKDRLWRALSERASAGEAPYAHAHDVLSRMLNRADFAPPYEFFASLLGAERGRAALIARLGAEANDPIDEFLAQSLAYEREHVASLQGFLGWIEAASTEIKRDLEAGHGKVRVMTVHGSKGLEANIVILPDTCSSPDGRKSDRVLWTPPDDPSQGGLRLPLWPGVKQNETELCSALRDDVRAAGLEEYRRLLYVAMTRARDRLYVAGWERKRRAKDAEHGRDEDSWYELVRPAMADMDGAARIADLRNQPDNEIIKVSTPQRAEPDHEIAGEVHVTATQERPDWLQRRPTPEPEPASPLSPSRPDGEEPPVMPPFADEDTARFRRGNLIHRLLQTLPDLDPAQRAQTARRWLDAAAGDLDVAQRSAIADETIGVLQHPELTGVFGPGSLAEVPIAGTVQTAEGPRTIAAQVDRLLVTPELVTIVDYKTNRPPPREESDVPETYFRQMALYRAALRGIYPGRDVRCLLVWTDGPRTMLLSEQRLDAHAP